MPFSDPTDSLPADDISGGDLSGDYRLTGEIRIPGDAVVARLRDAGLELYSEPGGDLLATVFAGTDGYGLVAAQRVSTDVDENGMLLKDDRDVLYGELLFPAPDGWDPADNNERAGLTSYNDGAGAEIVMRSPTLAGAQSALLLYPDGSAWLSGTAPSLMVDDPQTLTLASGWQQYGLGAGYPDAGYQLDSTGWVRMWGLVKRNPVAAITNGLVIATLPAAYRPDYVHQFPVVTDTGSFTVRVEPDGSLRTGNVGAGTPQHVALSVVQFPLYTG